MASYYLLHQDKNVVKKSDSVKCKFSISCKFRNGMDLGFFLGYMAQTLFMT